MEHKTQLLLCDASGRLNTQDTGAKLIGNLYARYRELRKRIASMLGRGDRDYGTLTALSQEIGCMRQKVRDELQRRRWERQRQNAARRGLVV